MDVCRAIATLGVVATHSFAPYTGSWDIPVDNIYLYKCIGLFSNVFNLSLFVFISGYVLSYQESIRPQMDSVKEVVRKKIKRLLIPSLFWGGLYSLLFGICIFSPKGLFEFISGVGHLWFLPMLFWVFVMFSFLKKANMGVVIIIPIALLSIVVPNVMSLGILSAFHYLIWFVIGYYTFIYVVKIKVFPRKLLIPISLFLIILFLSCVEVGDYINGLREMGVLYKFIYQIVAHSISFPIAIAGISFVYLMSLWLTTIIDFSDSRSGISKIVMLMSKYSMGIYIFHDFIIEGLYRKTDFLSLFYSYSPWIVFVCSILISVVLAKMVLRIPYLRKTI